jgi:hypothetical protein
MFACVNRQTSKGTSEMSNPFPDAESTQPNNLGRFRKSLFAVGPSTDTANVLCKNKSQHCPIGDTTTMRKKRMFRSHEYSTYRVIIVVIIVVSPSQARFPALPHRLSQKAPNLVVISERYHDHGPCIQGPHDYRSYSRPQSQAARHTSG